MAESRLFQIVYHLLNKREVTAAELAKKFEVSIRTIYRDIDKLSSAGIPVYTVPGHNGGIRLYESFVLDNSVLSEEDMQNILLGVESLSSVCPLESDAVLSKLKALFQTGNVNWMEVDYSRWGCSAEKETKIFRILKSAIQEKRQICFRYCNSKGEVSERECQPLKIFFKDKSWYLYAYCLKRNCERVFRISRINNLKVTDNYFESIPEENVCRLPSKYENMLEMELSFDKKAAYRVYDIFDDNMIKAADDKLIVKAAMPEDEWLFGFLMSFGDAVTVLSPQYLKEKIIERLKSALKHFETF